jgi:hypothetical protein
MVVLVMGTRDIPKFLSLHRFGKAHRVLLSFDKNHHYVPRLRRTFSSLD